MPLSEAKTANTLPTKKEGIGLLIQRLLLIGSTLKRVASLLKPGRKPLAKPFAFSVLTERRFAVVVLPVDKGIDVMSVGPIDDVGFLDPVSFISECCRGEELEWFTWEISNHQQGVLFLLEQGKKNECPPTAFIANDAACTDPLDIICGPLWLTGPDNTDDTIELLTAEEAQEVVEVLMRHNTMRIMNGLFLSTRGVEKIRK